MSKLSELKGSHLRPAASIEIRPSLVLDLWGPEHSGKSHLALTAPAANGMLYQTLEENSLDGVIQKFADKDILRASYVSDIPAGLNRAAFDEVKTFFTTQRQLFAKDVKSAITAKASAVVWDKASQLWEIIRYGHFGRLAKVPQHLYGPANAEFSDLVNSLPMAGINLVLIHESEEIWKDIVTAKGDVERIRTGQLKRKGQDRIGQLVDASVRCFREGSTFKGEIVLARQKPELIGTVLESPTFMDIALMVKPEVDAAVWL